VCGPVEFLDPAKSPCSMPKYSITVPALLGDGRIRCLKKLNSYTRLGNKGLREGLDGYQVYHSHSVDNKRFYERVRQCS
jgi:hypothetical protein